MDNWHTICSVKELVPNMGICALVEGKQVAVFNCTRTGSLYAISNYDPIGKANILSRGLIGSIEGEPVVASPLYKQHFNLETGECLEEPSQRIETFAVREQDGWIQIKAEEVIAA